jgi:hypothetical protein
LPEAKAAAAEHGPDGFAPPSLPASKSHFPRELLNKGRLRCHPHNANTVRSLEAEHIKGATERIETPSLTNAINEAAPLRKSTGWQET